MLSVMGNVLDHDLRRTDWARKIYSCRVIFKIAHDTLSFGVVTHHSG